MANVHDVAKYLLAQADEDAGDLISNLKLQKLAYYAQGFHLAMHGKPLFHEHIEAWQHGPVSPALYAEYRAFGANAIPAPQGFDFSVLSDDERELIDEVYSVYGQFSAWKLRNMTHDEPPWKNCHINDEISHDAMRAYFETQLN